MELSKIKGLLYGLAIGDAIGYGIEFMSFEKIQKDFGTVNRYVVTNTNAYKEGIFSDDTQMSISTISAILKSDNLNRETIVKNLINEYEDWYLGQNDARNRRHPGQTCLTALKQRLMDKTTHLDYSVKINESKGCGGIMRVAPIGLLPLPIDDIINIAIDCAYITHNHPLGYYSSGFFAAIIKFLTLGMSLEESILKTIEYFKPFNDESIKQQLIPLVIKAISLSKNNDSDIDNINLLGEGWVAEETLAIAVYCSLRYKQDYLSGVVASINHSGDSDSTGCLTGAILGYINGYENIPNQLIKKLEKHDIFSILSEKLILKFDYVKE